LRPVRGEGTMQAFLEYVVKGLVDRPDAVSVAAEDRSGTVLYELRVHPPTRAR
jgi:predicted RNA-binding protein YlqC (UPF0109 family)